MKCPYCSSNSDTVVDSRPLDDATVIRRRRECIACNKRYTTYERLEAVLITVIKKDGTKENFERSKVRKGLLTAMRKRSVSTQDLEKIINTVECDLQEIGMEVSSSLIGDKVMEQLKIVDEVAYFRFASVYKDFDSLDVFLGEIKDIVKNKKMEVGVK
ncbi:MAG: transcriptional repressor NrdR [bacterium]|nr:transcriptional repressor NrdR [bacterium]